MRGDRLDRNRGTRLSYRLAGEVVPRYRSGINRVVQATALLFEQPPDRVGEMPGKGGRRGHVGNDTKRLSAAGLCEQPFDEAPPSLCRSVAV